MLARSVARIVMTRALGERRKLFTSITTSLNVRTVDRYPLKVQSRDLKNLYVGLD